MALTGGLLDIFIAFAAGVVVSFTPCVYPLLPITAAVVAGANVSGRKLTGAWLSLIYVLGMSVSYSALAVVAVITGRLFGSWQTDPWAMFVVANIFLLFALIMFDVIPVPAMVLTGPSRERKGWLGILLMGIVSGLMVGPCTVPILGALLVQISVRESFVFGVLAVFFFALGMGTSLVLAGTFGGFLASLPRSGRWMAGIKRIAGLVLLAVAEYYFLKAGQLF